MTRSRARGDLIFLCVSLIGLSTKMSGAFEPRPADEPLAAARAFISEHERIVRPLEREAAVAWWNANVTGRDEDFQAKEQAQNRLDSILADREKFDRLKVS